MFIIIMLFYDNNNNYLLCHKLNPEKHKRKFSSRYGTVSKVSQYTVLDIRPTTSPIGNITGRPSLVRSSVPN